MRSSATEPLTDEGPRVGSLSEGLARFVADLRYEDVPPAVRAKARMCILDTLGAGLAGSRTDEGRSVIAAVAEYDAVGLASLWGGARQASAPAAALVNGTLAHTRELDDFGGCGHSGAVVVPAALAAGEQAGASGSQLLLAVIAGYEVAARVTEGAGGYTRHNARGWHSTGTCGSFGAAAATAKILGLSAEAVAAAIGLAGSFTGGLWAFLADGAMSKRLHPGKAAETGVIAGYLAKNGFTGPTQILEAQYGGFFSTYASEQSDPEAVLNGLGMKFRIMGSGFKPYACCRSIHGALDGLFDIMRTHHFTADRLEAVVVRGTEEMKLQVGRPSARNTLEAQMSLPYTLAVAVLAGRASLMEYDARWLTDPRVHGLMPKITMVAHPDPATEEHTEIEITTTVGERFTSGTMYATGHPRNPMSEADVEEKFALLAGLAVPAGSAGRLTAMVRDLEGLGNVRELGRLLTGPPS